LNLSSEEINELEGDLVVLESFNVVGVRSASLLEKGGNQINVGSNSTLEPLSISFGLSELVLLVSEDTLECITFGFFVLFTLGEGIDVLLENGLLIIPVSIKFSEILLGIVKEILKEISSLIDGGG
jgi:hypothetical protein